MQVYLAHVHAGIKSGGVVMNAHIAEEIATRAHAPQVDKAGQPYILHPQRVARAVAALYGPESDEVVVAFLHDVVEDTDWTLEDLELAGCTQRQLDAIAAITKTSHEPNVDYIARVKANEVAHHVKLADLADNSSPARMNQLDDDTQDRLRIKYGKALAQLTAP